MKGKEAPPLSSSFSLHPSSLDSMPTYEYKCSACGFTFEKFQPITAEPIKRCPQCGKAKAKRLISAGAGLIFKGSGFYITDYRDAGYQDKAKAESGAAAGGDGAAKTESKTDGKADSKGETKAETKSSGDAKAAAPKPEIKSSPKGEGKSPKKKS
jgi:putative FmdB family regulatory protein